MTCNRVGNHVFARGMAKFKITTIIISTVIMYTPAIVNPPIIIHHDDQMHLYAKTLVLISYTLHRLISIISLIEQTGTRGREWMKMLHFCCYSFIYQRQVDRLHLNGGLLTRRQIIIPERKHDWFKQDASFKWLFAARLSPALSLPATKNVSVNSVHRNK